MSSANVLPSAPPAETLYPVLAAPAENFRLTEISRIEKEISDQVEHYRLVLKKYKGSESCSLFRCWSWRRLCGSFFWSHCSLSYRSWGNHRRSCGRLCSFRRLLFDQPGSSQQEH